MTKPIFVRLTIKGKLISKDNEKVFGKHHGRPFTSAKFKRWEEDVRWQIQQQYKDKPLEGDLAIVIGYYFPDKRRPDLHNCPKGLCDAMNKLVYQDDRQLIQSHQMILDVDKEDPRVEVLVYTL